MSQSIYVAAVPDGRAIDVRTRFNEAIGAVTSKNCGTAFPTVTYPLMDFWRTDTRLIYLRSPGNDAWYVVGTFDAYGRPSWYVAGLATGALATVKCNYTALGPPTTGMDSTNGFAVGSQWLDLTTSPRKLYVCLAADVGAADWRLVSPLQSRVETTGLATPVLGWSGIPTGTNTIEFSFDCVTAPGSGTTRIILGTAAGYITTSYTAKLVRLPSTLISYTSAIPLFKQDDSTSRAIWGQAMLKRERGNLWNIRASAMSADGNAQQSNAIIDLGAALYQIQISTDAGNFPNVGMTLDIS